MLTKTLAYYYEYENHRYMYFVCFQRSTQVQFPINVIEIVNVIVCGLLTLLIVVYKLPEMIIQHIHFLIFYKQLYMRYLNFIIG